MNYLKQFKFFGVKENSSFRRSEVLSFPPLSKSCPTKFKPLTDKLEKKNIFLLNRMNCEIIAEGKLGEEDRSFPNLYNVS